MRESGAESEHAPGTMQQRCGAFGLQILVEIVTSHAVAGSLGALRAVPVRWFGKAKIAGILRPPSGPLSMTALPVTISTS